MAKSRTNNSVIDAAISSGKVTLLHPGRGTQRPKKAAAKQQDIHIVTEDKDSLLLTVRIAKPTLVANRAALLALFELANLLPDA